MKNLFDKIKELDPECIYVEDICKCFEISRLKARTLCEMAVSDGVFKRDEELGFYILVK